jgi:arginyl-tRNA synthetase
MGSNDSGGMQRELNCTMIRRELKKILQQIVPGEEILIDYVPKGKPGDYATNVALKIASKRGESPLAVAENLIKKFTNPMISGVTICEPGFINFEISKHYLLDLLRQESATIDIGEGKKILVEFVSVNPTGPINIAAARAAAVGDSLVRILNKSGFRASAEYYINDTGRQIDLLAESVKQRMNELSGKESQIPENGYHGEYIKEVAQELLSKNIDTLEDIKNYSVQYFVNKHKETLENFGVVFDCWTYESGIYKKGLVDTVLKILQDKKLTYEKDSALYFKTKEFGDSDDRVIITSDQRNTYLLPDIAYHLDKIQRNFDTLINIWGPDHHGYIKRLKGGIRALGYANDILKIIIAQEVKLKKGGEFLTMSKRAGTFTTLNELLEQVPKDVVRFFFLMRSNSQHLDFDLDLALKASEENPVYYVQYAHARIKSIIAFAKDQDVEFQEDVDLSLISEKEEISLAKEIMKFPEILEDIARTYEPYLMTYYLINLAQCFHCFYQKHRVVTDEKQRTHARLFLITKTAEVLHKGLGLLGVSCPEKM